eukprot:scaffold62727_cov62-Phaeocystis_antarctica.AAC.1
MAPWDHGTAPLIVPGLAGPVSVAAACLPPHDAGFHERRRGRGRRQRRRRKRRQRRRCYAAHRHQRHRRVSCEGTAFRVLEGKRRRVDVDRGCLPRVALVASQAPHRLPRSVGHAELAHGVAVHVVVEDHGADAQANVGASGAVVGESEELAHEPTGRLGVEVGP